MVGHILDYSENELKVRFEELNIKPFRANQVLRALFENKDLNDINNIPKAEKEIIEKNFRLEKTSIVKVQKSKDGTIKFGIALADGNIIEAVLMEYKYGNTLCISTQVGCNMGCKFCASTIGGKLRDLTSGEILSQVILVNDYLGGDLKARKITNIVLMGCGEPLDNYENVKKFIRQVSDSKYFGISERNISLSTCGIVEKIYQLADDGFKLNLTISLHAPNDEIRRKIMPIAKKYSIKEIIKACEYYFEKTKRRVYFEYALCDGINTGKDCVEGLANLLKGRVSHINVINLNAVEGKKLKGVTSKQAYKFVQDLCDLGMSATLRRTLGEDIDGACGQLRKRIMEEKC